jgi:hypothetical protein
MRYPKPAKGNKTSYRKDRFGEGSLERKLKHQERKQSKFDQETERLIAKYSKLKSEGTKDSPN